MKIVSLSGIIGYGFSEVGLRRALDQNPDCLASDGGSTDPGPYYLGAGVSFTNRAATKRDLALSLPEAIHRGIPFIIGTSGGAGGEPHLAWLRDIVDEVAREHGLSFRMALIHSEIGKDYLKRKIREGRVRPLDGDTPLSEADVEASVRLVGQIGVDPFLAALDDGAQVILAGRACDTAVFAAMPIRAGHDPGLAFHMAKIIECGAMCAKPLSGSDVMVADIADDHFVLEPGNPERCCLVERVAAHTLYEQSSPYLIYEPDGVVDVRTATFEQLTDRAVRVSGTTFEPAAKPTIKVEGVRLAGYRTIALGGIRDELMIRDIDAILDDVRLLAGEMVARTASPEDFTLSFRRYGKDGVLGPLEYAAAVPHEIGLVIDVVAKTQDIANSVCAVTRALLLHRDYDGRKATAGNIAFPYSPSDIEMGAVYNFNVYHLVEVDDLSETATVEIVEVSNP